MLRPEERVRFEQLVLPHLDAASNLARWLLRTPADAEDAVQEAMLRAYRFFQTFRGTEARAWLLQIVRNTCYTWIEKRMPAELMTEFNEELHTTSSPTPEFIAIQANNRKQLSRALELLPLRAREVVVLRELEECSYKEIITVTGMPICTVMSTLSRARERLARILTESSAREASSEL